MRATESSDSCRYWIVGIVLICLLWFGALALRAENRYVVAPGTIANGQGGVYTNWNIAATQIQWAVDVATNVGDIVWVSNGIYRVSSPVVYISGTTTNFSVVLITNSITLQSVNGPSVTVIDGNYNVITARCVYVTQTSTVSGFTIRNGRTDATFANANGAGIRASAATTVTNCIIHGNYAAQGQGGGVSTAGDTLNTFQIYNCTIYSNTAWQDGGGIYMSYGYPGKINKVMNCVFYRNVAEHGYGGENYPGGGGIAVDAVYAEIKNCLFYQNEAQDASWGFGGGVAVYTESYSPTLLLENCTFAGNTAADTGGGLSFNPKRPNATVTARNLIFYDNSAPNYPDVYLMSNFSMYNSCLSNTNGIVVPAGQGNITNNPLLVDTNVYNYRLSFSSPCVNTGTNQDWMTGAADLDGHRRIDRLRGIVDMGAYEFIYKITVFQFH